MKPDGKSEEENDDGKRRELATGLPTPLKRNKNDE